MSNGKRLELVDLLDQSERSVDALARAAGLNLTTAPAHLQTLKPAGLVTTRRQGLRIHCQLAGTDVAGPYAVVAYCRGTGCVLAHNAVPLLTTRGRAAKRLTDSLLEWRPAALPVEAGAV